MSQLLNKQNIQDIYELSPLQEGMYFHYLSDPGACTFVEQVWCRINGPVDMSLLKAAFNALSQRHEVLRTVFNHKKAGTPLQVVLRGCEMDFIYHDLRQHPPAAREALAVKIRKEDQRIPFDLNESCASRVILLRLDNNTYEQIWTHHHIILDGWSINILLKELQVIYKALLEEKAWQLPELRKYRYYIDWVRQRMAHDQETAVDYWQQYLRGFENDIRLPHTQLVKTNFRHQDRLVFQSDEQQCTQLTAIAMKSGVTINAMLQALWAVLLSRWNDMDDVMFGTVIAGRSADLPGHMDMVGLFINTLPVRLLVNDEQPFLSLAQTAHTDIIHQEQNGFLPLSLIQSACGLRQTPVNHLLVFENYGGSTTPVVKENSTGTSVEEDISMNTVSVAEEMNYDFNLVISARRKIIFDLTYNRALYSEADISGVKAQLLYLLHQITASPDILIGQLELFPRQEMKKVAAYPEDKTITCCFEAQVRLYPGHVAVTDGTHHFSYQLLDDYSNRMASHLQQYHQIKPDDRVGLLMHRSAFTIAAMLGILKSGAAYVPLDPEYPAERLEFMMKDAGIKVLLTDENITRFEGPVLAAAQVMTATEVYTLPERQHQPQHLAYIIYTSGSTGQPKGVMVQHAQVVQLLFQEGLPFSFSSADVWTLFHSISFDFSVWEIFGALLYGGRLVVVPQLCREDPRAFERLLHKEKVTVLNQVPAAFMLLSPLLLFRKMVLRYVIFGGEALHPASLADFHGRFPEVKLVNMYGITETTVHVTFKSMDDDVIKEGISNIGHPLPALQVLLLDRRRRLMPPGTIGELAVGGAGVTAGYLGQPELTAARFIPHPYCPGQRLYLSGDLAIQLHNGELVYVGRKDQQVKVRGYRIETGEIENVLLKLQGVENAAVITKKESQEGHELYAFVAGHLLNTAVLRTQLQQVLPAYMVPAQIILVAALPLTNSGKTDRKALLNIRHAGPETIADTLLPGTPVEEKLFRIWQEVLGQHIPLTDIRQNFFELGGHSIKAIMITSRVEKELQVSLKIADLFHYPTIQSLADFISGNTDLQEIVIGRKEVTGEYPASHGQQGVYLKRILSRAASPFNMIKIIEVADLNITALEEAWEQLLCRHESLRTIFAVNGGSIIQQVQPYTPERYPVTCIDARTMSERKITERLHDLSRHIFDLHQGPLIYIHVLREDTAHYLLQIVIDHIICDAWSMQLLERELQFLYTRSCEGSKDTLPPLPIQFRHYALWQKEMLAGQESDEHRTYWQQQLSGLPGSYRETLHKEMIQHALPFVPEEFNLASGRVFTFQPNEGGAYRTFIGQHVLDELNEVARTNHCSLFAVLVTALHIYVLETTGQRDVIIGTPVSLRDNTGMENLIGWFLDTLMIRTRIEKDWTTRQLLTAVSGGIAQALDHRVYPFEKILEDLDISFDAVGKVFIHLLNFDTRTKALHDFNSRHRTSGTPTFDLNFTFYEYTNGLELICDYRSSLFTPKEVVMVTAALIAVLEQLPARLAVSEISVTARSSAE
jgi:bacitracin synthase 3